MNAYKKLKEADAKVWRERTNASAWLAGLYVSQAIGACFAKGCSYPQKPLHLFSNDGAEPEAEESLPQPDPTKESIRAQSMLIDAMLARDGKPVPETRGAKRT